MLYRIAALLVKQAPKILCTRTAQKSALHCAVVQHGNRVANSRARNFSTKNDGTAPVAATEMPLFRHKYTTNLEGLVNKQIQSELNASLIYLSMSCYYARTAVALIGTETFFKKMYLEEQTHAFEFIKYQILRGGQVILYPLTVAEDQEWGCLTQALGVALEMEIAVKETLEVLLKAAEYDKDHHLIDLLTSKYIPEQNESINEIGRMITRGAKLVDSGPVGEEIFDQELLQISKTKLKSIE